MRIVIVVVLYKRSPSQSQTINSLAEVFRRNPALLGSLKVFIWDNTPDLSAEPEIPFPSDYRHGGGNLGTSGAYNQALGFAESLASPWLLLFDQDTTVSEELLPRMLDYSKSLESVTEVGAVAGFVYSHGALVSPKRLARFNQVRPIPPTVHGVYKRMAYAVNSATLMRVSALREIGGYSDEFWLDLSDVYVFQAMHRRGKYIYLAADLRVDHSIASMDFDNEMSPERYRNFIAAESAFIDLYLPPLERIAQLLRLFVRTIRQYWRYENKTFARISWDYFCRRIFQTRATRILGWRKQLASRDLPVIEDGRVIG
jgi:GT2 family glycosyltransferase